MTLYLHRAERADRLVTALGDLLNTPLPDPFATEIISVPTRGVERWLSQGLAQRLGASPGRSDGVCIGVSFLSPRRLVARALAGSAEEEDIDPWQPHRAVWPLLHVIDGCRDEPWAAVLWHYLGRGGSTELDTLRAGRRWSTARHLADLFAAYAAVRPAMIDNWSQGRDLDASECPLPADRAWQAELWRRLRDELGAPSPAERLASAVARLQREPESSDLPERLSVFGATRLAPDHLRVLNALADHRDVHLWLPHPSPALWDRVAAAARGNGFHSTKPLRRSDDTTDALVRHRLLAYLGRDVRELQLALTKINPNVVDMHHSAAETIPQPPTLLIHLQSDIAANRAPWPEDSRPVLGGGDQSVQFHACHGPDRQVDVLREVLVGLLADDASLEPRDIVVMCPDIEKFAPLIAASFGLDTPETQAEHPGHRLRVRLADRSLRQLNPLLALVSRLVGLADSRVGASALLDLCAVPPVARKFGFSQDDLERLQDLVPRAGVRWGFDAAHRSRFQMGEFRQNTWAAGL